MPESSTPIPTPTSTAGSVKIAAGGVFKDSVDILAPVLAHLISQGIKDFYLVLHNEHREVSRQVIDALGTRANFTVFHHNSERFQQGPLTNLLLQMARNEGFDVFLPFDADEFFVSSDPSLTLGEAISSWVAGGEGEQLTAPMVNFLVPNDVEIFTGNVLARIPYRLQLRHDVNSERVNRRLRPLVKTVVRISGISEAREIWLTRGNHDSLRGVTSLTRKPSRKGSRPLVFVCHIPWRSQSSALNPPLLHRALATAVPKQAHSEDLEPHAVLLSTWAEYSLTAEMLAGEHLEHEFFSLMPDDTCSRILTELTVAGFDPDDPYCRSAKTPAASAVAHTARVFENDLVFDSAVVALMSQYRRVNEQRKE
jgi:hypothetical protein